MLEVGWWGWGDQGRIGTYNFVVPGLSEPLF